MANVWWLWQQVRSLEAPGNCKGYGEYAGWHSLCRVLGGEVVGHCALFLWLSEEAFTVVPLEAQQVRIVSWMYKVLPRGLLRMEDS